MIITCMNSKSPFPKDYARVIAFDIDGTLAQTTWRQHHLDKEPPDWEAFIAAAINDKPNSQLLYLNELFFAQKDNVILIVTGRSYDQSHDVTFRWLDRVGVSWHQILFRAPDDYRPDHDVKTEMLEFIKSNWWESPFMVFDDRKSVIENCWIKNGIYCLDVGNGNGDF